MNKRIIIVAGSIFLLIIAVTSIFFLVNRSPGEATGPTGGSGELPVGSVVIYGYETPSSTGANLPIGYYLNVDQQAIIRSSLEEILFEKDPKKVYRGTIVPGTAAVDYRTNTVTFTVEIEEPKTLYTINFNTVSNEIDVLAKQNDPTDNN